MEFKSLLQPDTVGHTIVPITWKPEVRGSIELPLNPSPPHVVLTIWFGLKFLFSAESYSFVAVFRQRLITLTGWARIQSSASLHLWSAEIKGVPPLHPALNVILKEK